MYLVRGCCNVINVYVDEEASFSRTVANYTEVSLHFHAMASQTIATDTIYKSGEDYQRTI